MSKSLFIVAALGLAFATAAEAAEQRLYGQREVTGYNEVGAAVLQNIAAARKTTACGPNGCASRTTACGPNGCVSRGRAVRRY